MVKSVLRKLQSAFAALRQGEFVAIANDILKTLRLTKFMYFGLYRLLMLPAIDALSDMEETSKHDEEFDLSPRTDLAVIPELLVCLECSDNYNNLSKQKTSERFQYLLQHGSTVWVLRANNEIAGFFWVSPGEYIIRCIRQDNDEYSYILELPDDVSFIEFVFIKPSHRRHGLFSKAFRRFCEQCPGTIIASNVHSYNDASYKAHKKLGFREAGSAVYWRCFGWIFASLRFAGTCRPLFRLKKNEPRRIRIQK